MITKEGEYVCIKNSKSGDGYIKGQVYTAILEIDNPYRKWIITDKNGIFMSSFHENSPYNWYTIPETLLSVKEIRKQKIQKLKIIGK